jgi:hypothetical protein
VDLSLLLHLSIRSNKCFSSANEIARNYTTSACRKLGNKKDHYYQKETLCNKIVNTSLNMYLDL